MRCSRALGLMCSSLLLLPLAAEAEAELDSRAHGQLIASAHVRFRIIIPTVLSLNVSGGQRAAGAQTVSIESNARMVALGATAGTSSNAEGRVILGAAGRGVRAREAPCAARALRNTASSLRAGPEHTAIMRTTCTVSMP